MIKFNSICIVCRTGGVFERPPGSSGSSYSRGGKSLEGGGSPKFQNEHSLENDQFGSLPVKKTDNFVTRGARCAQA